MSDWRPELLPCPFCGGEAELDGNRTWTVVRCRGCSATVGRRFGDEAVEAWNRRPERRRIADESSERLSATYWKGYEAGRDYGYTTGWSDGYDDGFASADDWLMRSEDALREHGWIRTEDGATIEDLRREAEQAWSEGDRLLDLVNDMAPFVKLACDGCRDDLPEYARHHGSPRECPNIDCICRKIADRTVMDEVEL